MKVRQSGRHAYPKIERLFHERARLGLLIALINHPEGLSFMTLGTLCALTPGNMGRHVQNLLEKEVIEEETKREGKIGRPTTIYRITATGHERFSAYLRELERVVSDVRAHWP